MAEETEKPTTDDISKKLDLADSWLTKFGTILKKHWGKLLLLLVGYCVYWAFTQPAPLVTEEPVIITDTVYQEVPVTLYDDTNTTYQE